VAGAHRWSQIAGRGPAVVLLHAGIADARMWDPQFDALARDHRVLRIDLAGYGRSPLEPGPLCHAEDVALAMDRHDMPSATLVGASFGGAVALDLALGRPERVDALVLAAAPLGDTDWSPELRAAWGREEEALEAGDLDTAVEDVVRFWVDGPGRPAGSAPADVRGLVAQMQRRAFELQLPLDGQVDETELVADPGARLGELDRPVLVIDGEHDVPDFRAVARRLAAELPDARALTIAGAAHLPSLEQPEAFEEALGAFLTGRD